MADEFEAIEKLFQSRVPWQHESTRLGNGDDASVHHIPEGMALVVSTDSAVSGVHWPVDMPLHVAAKRAVCAALSDLAAMGADATWIWLSVVAKDMQSLKMMSNGVVEVCQRYQLELAGGDTVHAAVNMLNVTVGGLVPKSQAMTRQSAQVGDDIWLWGDLGLSASGLQQWLTGEAEGDCISAFQTVEPLLAQGVKLRQLGVRCCMDVSDGLMQDAGHIARASDVCMGVALERLKQLPSYQRLLQTMGDDAAQTMVLNGGEDFALLFTAKPALKASLQAFGAYQLGVCQAGQGVALLNHGRQVLFQTRGYEHFG